MTTCPVCGHREEWAGQHLTLTDGTVRCSTCWNESVRQRHADAKAARDAEPLCEACGKGRQTWIVAGAHICGRCKTRARRNAEKAVPRHMRGVAMFGGVQWTREAIIDLARQGSTRAAALPIEEA